jgi:hypothetical protein
MEGADREAGSRGIQLRSADQQPGRKRHAEKGEIPLQRAMEACGVMVDKAPIGMSRNTSNHTTWSKRQKCIQWTVEWIYGELGSRVKEPGSMLETMTLKDAFQEHLAVKQRNSRKKMEVNTEGSDHRQKRQKRGSKTVDERTISENQATEESVSRQVEKGPDTNDWEKDESNSVMVDKIVEAELTTTTADHKPSLHFYIHQTRPTRPTPKTALLAVEHTTKFSECLRGVTVREYPTIYALALSPEQVSRSGEYLLETETAFSLPILGDEAAEAAGNIINGAHDAEKGELDQTKPSNVVDVDGEAFNAEQASHQHNSIPTPTTTISPSAPD